MRAAYLLREVQITILESPAPTKVSQAVAHALARLTGKRARGVLLGV